VRSGRFSPVGAQHAVLPYARFTLSFCDVDDLLAARRIERNEDSPPSALVTDELRFDGAVQERPTSYIDEDS